MSFNVSEFKSRINSYGGLATTNKFYVMFTGPKWYTESSPSENTINAADAALADPHMLSFLCDTTNLPGKSLQTIDYRPEGFGKISKIPFDIQHDNLSMTFMCDAEHRVLRFFQMWMQEITNTGSVAAGPLATHKNRTSFEMNYKENYKTTLEIYVLDDAKSEVLKYSFFDCYPVQLGSVSLGWEQNDTLMKLPVEWTYSTYTVFRDSLPTETYAGRGVNLFQGIAYLNGVAGIINSLERPRSIQDLINQVVNVRPLF